MYGVLAQRPEVSDQLPGLNVPKITTAEACTLTCVPALKYPYFNRRPYTHLAPPCQQKTAHFYMDLPNKSALYPARPRNHRMARMDANSLWPLLPCQPAEKRIALRFENPPVGLMSSGVWATGSPRSHPLWDRLYLFQLGKPDQLARGRIMVAVGDEPPAAPEKPGPRTRKKLLSSDSHCRTRARRS